MPETLTLAHGTIDARLVGATREAAHAISDLLSYATPTAPGSAPARNTLFTPGRMVFPAGFVHLVHEELTRVGFAVRLVASRPLAIPLGPEDPIVDEHGNGDPRYDFQPIAMRQVERHGRGIVQVATGGGKSKIARLIVSRFGRRTLFLTTRSILMRQMAEPYLRRGEPVGLVGDGEWSPSEGLNCAMVQTLKSMLAEPDPLQEVRSAVGSAHLAAEKLGRATIDRDAAVAIGRAAYNRKLDARRRALALLSTVEVVIGEEAHEVGGQGYFDILRHCTAATIRVALTATPFMRDNVEDNLRLMAAFGPVLVRVSEQTLIDRGILATPLFRYVDASLGPRVSRTTPYAKFKANPGAYTSGIVRSEARNGAIVDAVSKAAARRMPALVLVQRTEHGEILEGLLAAAGVRAEFIKGEDDRHGRKAALSALAAGRIDCLIGTNILDVGVDVPAVSLVVLAGGGKAEVALRQRIGRGLRAKRSGPNFAFVLDFSDFGNATLAEHARTRRGIVEDTPGFADGILPEGDDFPWHLFDPR